MTLGRRFRPSSNPYSHLHASGPLWRVSVWRVHAQFSADAGPMPVSPAFAVDLRPRMVAPIAPDAPFCCVARQVCAARVDADDQPVEVGRQSGTQLQSAVERNEIQRSLLAKRLAGRPLPLPISSWCPTSASSMSTWCLMGCG
ncbi:phthiocerol/phthiodiolone dimycocerosyl transferase family protein [Jatrophihabitans lederbergiae]|uniref:phthiocerol/phthiodiolone dimycocerosyl transferase family protein n=1 Tax=Jatrophihabitans lederbergiae TaxID=3075547 RepID=UPI0037C0648C